MRADELLAWLSALAPAGRDAAFEQRFGIVGQSFASAPPGEHLVGYHASGVAPIVRALVEVPVLESDVVVDLGAGLGKVVLLAHLLTGATARGVEIQPALAVAARALSPAITITCGDARDANLDDGTVFFLYAPFTGPVLREVVARLHGVAEKHAIVVCALGIDLVAPWLRPRVLDAFWLAIYDSVVPGVPPRAPAVSPIAKVARAVAREERGT